MQPPSDLVTNVRRKTETLEQFHERYDESVPWKFQSKACTCHPNINDGHRTAAKSENGLVYNWINGVPYHWDCNGVPGIWTYLEICFSCEELYLVKVFPDRMMLCEDCGG